MSFESIPDLLAEILEEQKNTRCAVILLAEALAGIRNKVEKAKAETTTVIEKAKATVAINGASSTPESSSPADAVAQEPAPVAPSPAPVAASVDYETVKKAIVKMTGTKGRDAVVALLQTFGASKGPDLKPEQFAEFITAAGAA